MAEEFDFEKQFDDEDACPNCGHEVNGEGYCPNCGAVLNISEDESEEGYDDEEETDYM